MHCRSACFTCSRPHRGVSFRFHNGYPLRTHSIRLSARLFAVAKSNHADIVSSTGPILEERAEVVSTEKARNSAKGVGLSEEHKRKISIALKRKWQDPAFRKRIAETRASLSKKKRSEIQENNEIDSSLEVGLSVKESLAEKKKSLAKSKKEKISAALKRKWQDPEFRKRISEGVKKKWEDEDYREKVSNSLKGKKSWNQGKKSAKRVGDKRKKSGKKALVPWNKGRGHSEITRQRMRAARLGKTHSEATRRKMSAAHAGLSHTPETMRLLSQRLSGVPKGVDHKARIAAAQRKRFSAIRALQAIETVHKLTGPLFAGKRRARYMYCAASSTVGDNSGLRLPKRQTRAEVLNSHKTQLREYRDLQAELSPWMSAFTERHGKRPTLVDVEATQITWLINRFKDYTVLREKLLVDIPVLRSKIASAQNDYVRPMECYTNLQAAQDGLSEKLAAAIQYRRSLSGKTDDEGRSTAPIATARVEKAMNAAMEYRRKQARASAAVAKAAAVNARSSGQKKTSETKKTNSATTAAPMVKEDEIRQAQEQAEIAIKAMEDAQKKVIENYSLGGTN
ncbi:hypothetical protein BSKO_07905 [Bryopsis sp. KO-2023]|nr:hypothetical protein BSKO_07905 [Bryopsis sp. KO-2023]